MTDRTLIIISRAVAILTLGLGVAALIVVVTADEVAPSLNTSLQQLSGTVIIPAVVWIAIPKVPRNGSVWAFAAVGVSLGLVSLGDAVAFATSGITSEDVNQLLVGFAPADLPLASSVGLMVALSAWIVSFVLVPTMVLLLFPDGRFPSPQRRWRWVGYVTGATVTIGMSALVATYWPTRTTSYANLAEDSIGRSGSTSILGHIAGVASLVSILLVAVSIIGYVVKWKRARGEERLQYRWVGFAFFVFAVNSLATIALSPFGGNQVSSVASWAAIIMIPVAYVVAILRYRLYGIDVVISKSLTFGVLAVFIGAVYVAIVVGIGALVDDGGGSSFGLSVAATAVVALAFQPVRSRVEWWVKRLVYGKRATPYEVLARFSHRSSEDDDVLHRIPRMIVDGTGASHAALWVANAKGFRTVSSWPEAEAVRTIPGDDGFEDPDADLSWTVVHDGEALGGISLVTERGSTITPLERELVTRLADGLGLTLRNSQLTAALRRQVRDLQRSRDRVVTAADEARRSLEHDLDSGPQQQLVAVKVKLGPLHRLAEQAGAVKTAAMLAELEHQAGDAIAAVRDFAAGIYPPLLGADGLVVALTHETNKAAIPVDIDAREVGRYPRDVEAAVYFCILEALQNSTKYADASRAVVRLRQRNGDLSFEVSDDGRGFDPASVAPGAGLNGIADRMDTIGGSSTIESAPGRGTVVAGAVPISDG